MKFSVKVDIPLLVVGCDFRMVSTPYRECLLSTSEQRIELFNALKRIDSHLGFAALETCNRVEWIASSAHPNWIADILKAKLLDMWQNISPHIQEPAEPYAYLGEQALHHVLRVVVGWESLAIGEAQIAGQFQDAMRRARREKTSCPLLNRLGSTAGRLAKTAHRLGFRSNSHLGIHGLASQFLRNYGWDDGSSTNRERLVAIVGMGKIGRKVAQVIEEMPNMRVIRVNRTISPKQSEQWQPLTQLPSLVREADALVMATGAPQPIVEHGDLNLQERTQPLLILDIGVPRQVADEILHAPDVIYRNIDDLLDIPQNQVDPQIAAVLQAEIEREAMRFMRNCLERDLELLLAHIYKGREHYISDRLPDVLNLHLDCIEEKQRKQMELAIRQLWSEYANDIHDALYTALQKYWSNE
jgi:glutamyl-tRNA reductase